MSNQKKGGSMTDKTLTNKVAIVTGGGKGLGKAISRALGERGARIAIADVDEKAGNQVSR